jgi:hypothetical protein
LKELAREQLKDKTFWDEVKITADAEINQRLPNAWANFLSGYATSFTQDTLQDQLRKLSTSLTLYCPKCGGPHQYTITTNEIGLLIRYGRVTFSCRYCTGLFKPAVTLTLGGLLWIVYNGNTQPILRARAIIKKKNEEGVNK